jgi:hypothetical protein
MIDWLGAEALAGRLGDADRTAFFDQCLRPVLAVECTGFQTFFHLQWTGLGPGGPGWWTAASVRRLTLDGIDVPTSDAVNYGVGFYGGTMQRTLQRELRTGRHKLAANVHIEVWGGPDFGNTSSRRNTIVYRRDVPLSAVFDVGSGPPERIEK